jgi:hypothetical protein
VDHAYQLSWSRKGGWAIALSPILNSTITVARLTQRGYEPLVDHYCKVCPLSFVWLADKFSFEKQNVFYCVREDFTCAITILAAGKFGWQ